MCDKIMCPISFIKDYDKLNIGLFLKSSSTTDESAIVEISPKSRSLRAILRRTRRIILPERVFGRPGAFWMISGCAIGPMRCLTENK